MQMKSYISDERLQGEYNIPDMEILKDGDPAITKKNEQRPRDIRAEFRDDDSVLVFERADLPATRYKHLPDSRIML